LFLFIFAPKSVFFNIDWAQARAASANQDWGSGGSVPAGIRCRILTDWAEVSLGHFFNVLLAEIEVKISKNVHAKLGGNQLPFSAARAKCFIFKRYNFVC
jgi:hypothetical protein